MTLRADQPRPNIPRTQNAQGPSRTQKPQAPQKKAMAPFKDGMGGVARERENIFSSFGGQAARVAGPIQVKRVPPPKDLPAETVARIRGAAYDQGNSLIDYAAGYYQDFAAGGIEMEGVDPLAFGAFEVADIGLEAQNIAMAEAGDLSAELEAAMYRNASPEEMRDIIQQKRRVIEQKIEAHILAKTEAKQTRFLAEQSKKQAPNSGANEQTEQQKAEVKRKNPNLEDTDVRKVV